MSVLELLRGGKKTMTVNAVDQALAKASTELDAAQRTLATLQADRPRLLIEATSAELRAHDDQMSDVHRELERLNAAVEELNRRKGEAQLAEAYAALTDRIKGSLGWHKRRSELLKTIQRNNLAAAKALRALQLDDQRTIAVHQEADIAGRLNEFAGESEVSIRDSQPYLDGQASIPSVLGPDRLWPINLQYWANAEERFAGVEAEMAGKPFRASKQAPERPAPVPATPEKLSSPRLNARREGDAVHMDTVSPIDGRIVVLYSPTKQFGLPSKIIHTVLGAGAGRVYPFVDLRTEAGFYQAMAQVSEYAPEHRSEIIEIEAAKVPA